MYGRLQATRNKINKKLDRVINYIMDIAKAMNEKKNKKWDMPISDAIPELYT